MALNFSSVDRIMKDTPEYKTFLTVDELSQSFAELRRKCPCVVELSTVGRSRVGNPIQILIIGKAKQTTFLLSTPDHNKAVGDIMLEFVWRELAEDEEFREWTGFDGCCQNALTPMALCRSRKLR